MCGLVGLIINHTNGFNNSEIKTIEQMLYVDVLRGEDATGVAVITNNKKVEVVKDQFNANVVLLGDEYRQVNTAMYQSGVAVLGHNRKKTSGRNLAENAHPFVVDNRYVFMHNGTLIGHKELADTEVDSEALGIHLTKCEGNKEKLEEALGAVRGAYACVWYDQDKHTLYLLRNSERPLVIAELRSVPGFAFASEGWMIQGPCNRNGISIEKYINLEPHTLYSIDLSDFKLTLKEEKLEIKKSNTSITTNGVSSVIGVSNEFLSKSQFKKLKKKLAIGAGEWFEVDDFKQVLDNKSPHQSQDWYLYGTNPEYPGLIFKALIVDKTESDMYYEYYGNFVEGTVSSMIYDEAQNTATIWVRNIKNFVTEEINETKTCH